jgi:hypothetical protein
MLRDLILMAAFLAPLTAMGQRAPRVLTLGKPTASHPEQFGLVNNVRELLNGQVMVADPLSGDLWLLSQDLRSGTKIGREGSGPGEYRQPDAVWPMPGDSTLLVDLGNARLSIYGRTGAFGRSIPIVPAGFTPGAGPPTAVIPRGVDGRGRLYLQGPPVGRNGPVDSVAVMRFDPATSKMDTVILVKGSEFARSESGSANAREVRMRPVPLSDGDGWAVAASGAIAVARKGNYRVDWVSPTGQRLEGPELSYERVRVGDAEKKEWIAFAQLVGAVGMRIEDDNGRMTMSFSRNRRQETGEGLQWPDFKPPFDAGTARIDAAGRLWIQRHVRAGQPKRYDVLGGDGALLATLSLSRDRRIGGFGSRAMYVIAFDADGLQTLERYAMPL